jgi:uncharacterized protein (DUF58 family)
MRTFKWILFAVAVVCVYVAAATFSLIWLVPAVTAVLVSIPLHARRASETFVPERAPKPEKVEADAEFDFYDNETGEVFTVMTPAERKAAAERVKFK